MNQFNNYSGWNYQMPITSGSLQVPKVHGVEGANSFSLPANSSILLLDDTDPIVYLKTTDAGGYGTVSKWGLKEIKDPTPVDISAVSNRIDGLESKLDDILRRIGDGKSYSGKNERPNYKSGNTKSENQ